jgi:hypothetical protein
MTSVYFHEDDYCQIEILPLENLKFCLKQTGSIDEFAEAHKDGGGYTDIFVRDDVPVRLYDKKIPSERFERTISEIFPKYDEVYTGYGSFRERCRSASAFGRNENVVVFYQEENGSVRNIWLTLHIETENDIRSAGELFTALSTLGNVIIVDWNWKFIEKMNEDERIEQYLQDRLDFWRDHSN